MRYALLVLLMFPLSLNAATASYSFHYDYTGLPACTVSLTTNCLNGFILYDITGTRRVAATIPNPGSPSGSMTITGSYTETATGRHTVVVTAVWVLTGGGTLESADSNSATFQVAPPSPTALTVTALP